MIYRYQISVAFSVLFILVLSSVKAQNGPDNATFQSLAVQTSGQEAHKQLAALIQATGHRLSGTPEGRAASAYIYNALKTYQFGTQKGTSAALQPFMMKSWTRQVAHLEIAPKNSDNFSPIPCVSLALTPVKSDLQAPIFDAYNGLPEDWVRIKDSARGKTVLINIGNPASSRTPAPSRNQHRTDKIAAAIKAGAKGIIMVNSAPGDILLTGTASLTGELIDIPAVSISANNGVLVRQWLANGDRLFARIEVMNQVQQQQVQNVVATITGTQFPDEEIVVGCHLDSWDLANGACDNGVGTASVLELARLFMMPQFKPARTIKFVWFMGEEQGMLGSKYYVSQLTRADRKKVKHMVNLDMAYNADGLNDFEQKSVTPQMEGFVRTLNASDTTLKVKHLSTFHWHSDHEPFYKAGIAVSTPNSNWLPEALHCYHADCDRLNWVSPEGLARTVRLTAQWLWWLSR